MAAETPSVIDFDAITHIDRLSAQAIIGAIQKKTGLATDGEVTGKITIKDQAIDVRIKYDSGMLGISAIFKIGETEMGYHLSPSALRQRPKDKDLPEWLIDVDTKIFWKAVYETFTPAPAEGAAVEAVRAQVAQVPQEEPPKGQDKAAEPSGATILKKTV